MNGMKCRCRIGALVVPRDETCTHCTLCAKMEDLYSRLVILTNAGLDVASPGTLNRMMARSHVLGLRSSLNVIVASALRRDVER